MASARTWRQAARVPIQRGAAVDRTSGPSKATKMASPLGLTSHP
jgi:hypothetical protein